ncbi:MAG: abortive infection system antitoxin AbiGi family protein [Candidatus Omnitrophota bacterium]
MANTHDLADFLQRFSTKVLWHFTGYDKSESKAYEILKLIVESKILKLADHPEPVIMDGGEHRWVYTYSCMCDIPFKDLRIHTVRYGKYGLAFNKEKAIKSGHFNPILYIHKDSRLFKLASQVLPEIDNLVLPQGELNRKVTRFLALLGTFVKPSDLTAPIIVGNVQVDKEQNNNFYYEREWRSAFQWEFISSDLEAIMVPKRDFNNIKQLLDKNEFIDTPIIPYEMVEKL